MPTAEIAKIASLEELDLELLRISDKGLLSLRTLKNLKKLNIAMLSCGGRNVRVAAPVAGRILSVNPDVRREPTLAKSENYGSGWLFAIEPANQEWKKLPFGDRARSWLRAEGERLELFYETQLGLAAADGGALMASPLTSLTEDGWRRLTGEFLAEKKEPAA